MTSEESARIRIIMGVMDVFFSFFFFFCNAHTQQIEYIRDNLGSRITGSGAKSFVRTLNEATSEV